MRNSSLREILYLTTLIFIHPISIAQPTFITNEDPRVKGEVWSKVNNMSDEFEGNEINTNKWQTAPVGNGWTWIGRPPGLFDASAVTVADGNLQVTVSVLASPEMHNGKEFLYKGAIVRSINAGSNGWYYECRMKANKTEMSSTFWLMSQNSDCMKKHELDIQECVGHTTELTDSWGQNWDQIFHSNAFHRSTSCVPEPVQRQGQFTPDVKNWERYFVYGAWWKSPTEVRFYLDGEYKYTINPSTPFDMPLWIQMAIETYSWNPVPEGGGKIATEDWGGRTTMYDWVRVWRTTSTWGGIDIDSNLIKNAGFEYSSFDNWTSTGTVSINPSNKYLGLYSTKLSGPSSIMQVVQVSPNTTYSLSAMVKTIGSSSVTVGIRGNNSIEQSASLTSSTFDTVYFTYTTSATENELEIFTELNGDGEIAYVDDFVLQKSIPSGLATSVSGNGAFVNMFPNPINREQTLTFTSSNTTGSQMQLSVYNQTGKLLFVKNIVWNQANKRHFNFNLNELEIYNPGLYIIKFKANNHIELKKLVVR